MVLIAGLISVVSGLLVIIYSSSNENLSKLLNSLLVLVTKKIEGNSLPPPLVSSVVKPIKLYSEKDAALILIQEKEKFIRQSFNADVVKMINTNKTNIISSCRVYDALPAATVNKLILEEVKKFNSKSTSTKLTVSVEHSSSYHGIIARIKLISA